MQDGTEKDEEMKDLMATKTFVGFWRDSQYIDQGTNGVGDASCKHETEATWCQGKVCSLHVWRYRPSHQKVKDGRYPFWTGDPEGLEDNSCNA